MSSPFNRTIWNKLWLLVGAPLLWATACTDADDVVPSDPDETCRKQIALVVDSGDGQTTDDTGSTSTTAATKAALPAAEATFCFWEVSLFQQTGEVTQFIHSFDVTPDVMLDSLYQRSYTTPYYYPTNYASIYGYAYAVDTAARLTATTTQVAPVDTTLYTDLSAKQTVTFKQGKGVTTDSTYWGQVYVARSQSGAGYVSASLTNDYTNSSDRRFYFSHCTTRIALQMCRSTNMSGSGSTTVSNIKVYAPKRCRPTQLDWNAQKGFYAVSCDSTTQGAEKVDSTTALLAYKGQLYAGDYVYAGSLYLLLDDYVLQAQKDCSQLQLYITVYYDKIPKDYTLTLSMTPDPLTKTDNFYHINESYTVKIIFESDAVTAKGVFDSWDTGNAPIITWIKPGSKDDTTTFHKQYLYR